MKSIIILSSLIIIFSSCNSTPPKQQELISSYKSMRLNSTSATIYTDFTAELIGAIMVDIRPRIQGYIENIYVQEGSNVKKGEALFQIDNRELKQMLAATNANISSSRATLSNAELEVEKLTPLVKKGIISHYELNNAKSNLEYAKSNLDYATSQHKNAQINLSFATITSPVDGVIGRIVVRTGTLVSPNNQEPLTTVSDDSEISAYFSIDEKSMLNINDFKFNTSAAFSKANLIMANGQQYPLEGDITFASGMIDINTGSMQVKATFDNPDRVLKSGGSGVVRINNKLDGVILIPQKATFDMQDKKMVYTITDSSTVSSRIISIKGEDDFNYIVDDGVYTDDIILLEGIGTVRNGDKIKAIL